MKLKGQGPVDNLLLPPKGPSVSLVEALELLFKESPHKGPFQFVTLLQCGQQHINQIIIILFPVYVEVVLSWLQLCE